MFIALPKKAQNLTGRRFGCLVTIGPVVIKRYKGATHVIWQCRCDCGNETSVSAGNLRRGQSRSCGCMKGKWCSDANIKYEFGKAKPLPEYRAWCHMKGRCYDENDKRYADYGGRGIRVCNRWLDDFAAFYSDMGQRPSSRHTIDRIENNGDYEPNNCRWATFTEQNRNRRISRYLTVNGERRHAKEWAGVFGVPYGTIVSRLQRGWGERDAVTRPLTNRGQDFSGG